MKNTKRRWMVLILVVAFILLPTRVRAQEDLTQTPGVLRVGMEANYAPFNWSQSDEKNEAYPLANSNGEYVTGYDVWMAKKLADGLGYKLEIVKIEWDGLTPALLSGKIDAIIAGMSPTSERKEAIDFSSEYYSSDLVIVVPKSSPLMEAKSIQDFSGKRIVGQLNTFHNVVIDQIQGVEHMTPLDSFPTMISSLKSNQVDGYVSERPGAMAAIVSHPDLDFVSFEEGQGFEADPEFTTVAVGTRKNSALTQEISSLLSNISEGERQEAMERMIYYNSGLTPPSKNFFSQMGNILENYGPLFLRGAAMTMLISILSTVIGFVIGLFAQVIRVIPIKTQQMSLKNALIHFLKILINIYIELFRGTPMMVQSMLIFYGSKLFLNIDMSASFAAILIVSINTGAYLAEVIRGGIDSVDKGQFEACKAIGLSHWQTMSLVILPQTIKAILPSIANEFVVNIKDTSVLNVISVTELFFVSKSIAGSTYLIFQTYLITAVIYLVLTFLTTRLINYFGRRTGKMEPFVLSSVTGGQQ